MTSVSGGHNILTPTEPVIYKEQAVKIGIEPMISGREVAHSMHKATAFLYGEPISILSTSRAKLLRIIFYTYPFAKYQDIGMAILLF